MKKVHYKYYKAFNNGKNLPKYDPGMFSGFLGTEPYIPQGETKKTPINITNSLVPEAITNGITSVISSFNTASPFIKEGLSVSKNIKSGLPMELMSGLLLKPGTLGNIKVGTGGDVINGITDTTTSGTNPQMVLGDTATNGGAAKSAIGSASKVAAAVQTAKGLYDTYNLMTTNKGVSFDDILKGTGMARAEINGVGYDYYTGYDVAGLDKLKNDMVKSSWIEGAAYGNELAELPADLLSAPTGSLSQLLLRIPFMGIGAIAGYFRGRHMKKELEKREQEVRSAISGFNRLSESEAATKGLQNKYYLSHYMADGGKLPSLVGEGEVVGDTYKGKDGLIHISEMHTVPHVPGLTAHRLDNVKLDLGDSNFVGGNKIGPDGKELSEHFRENEVLFNSGIPELKNIAEKNTLALLKLLKKLPNDNPNPYDVLFANGGKNMKKCNCGKEIKRCDYGEAPTFLSMAPYAIIPGLAKIGYNFAQWRKDKDRSSWAMDPYKSSSQIQSILSRYPTDVYIGDQLNAATKVAKLNLHSISQAGALPNGLRRALLQQTYSDYMNTLASIYTNRNAQRNELLRGKTQLAAQYADQDAARQMQGADIWAKSLAQAEGAKYKNMDAHGTGVVEGIGDIFSNLSTLSQFLHNIGLWREDLDNKKLAVVNKINQGGA